MTVRFLTSWNGYSAGDRATLTNESALISAGIARADYVQDGASPLYPPDASYANAVVGAGAPQLRERIQTGALLCDWGSGGTLSTSGSTGTGYAFALDPSVLINGKPAVKCTFPSDATAQTFIGIWTPANPIRLRDVQAIHIPIIYTSSNGAGGVGNPLQLWLQTSSGKSLRMKMDFANGATASPIGSAGVAHTYSIARGAAAISGTGTFADLDTASETITSLRIVQATTGATANANPIWVGEIRADARRERGRVSIVLDGEYSSQYSMIHPMLARNGIRASFALTNSDIAQSGRMTAAQLDEMYAYGHEMINHTFDATKSGGYMNATDWPTALSISEDIRAQLAYFRARGWYRGIGYGVWGFTSPFDSTYTQARQNTVRDGVRNGGLSAIRRSVPYNETGKHLIPIARMPIDPLVVTGAIQITSTDNAATVKAVIDAAETTGQWAIITIHRAVADSATPGPLEMRESAMREWIDYAAARQAAGGIFVAPFGETFSQLFCDKHA